MGAAYERRQEGRGSVSGPLRGPEVPVGPCRAGTTGGSALRGSGSSPEPDGAAQEGFPAASTFGRGGAAGSRRLRVGRHTTDTYLFDGFELIPTSFRALWALSDAASMGMDDRRFHGRSTAPEATGSGGGRRRGRNRRRLRRERGRSPVAILAAEADKRLMAFCGDGGIRAPRFPGTARASRERAGGACRETSALGGRLGE